MRGNSVYNELLLYDIVLDLWEDATLILLFVFFFFFNNFQLFLKIRILYKTLKHMINF